MIKRGAMASKAIPVMEHLGAGAAHADSSGLPHGRVSRKSRGRCRLQSSGMSLGLSRPIQSEQMIHAAVIVVATGPKALPSAPQLYVGLAAAPHYTF